MGNRSFLAEYLMSKIADEMVPEYKLNNKGQYAGTDGSVITDWDRTPLNPAEAVTGGGIRQAKTIQRPYKEGMTLRDAWEAGELGRKPSVHVPPPDRVMDAYPNQAVGVSKPLPFTNEDKSKVLAYHKIPGNPKVANTYAAAKAQAGRPVLAQYPGVKR